MTTVAEAVLRLDRAVFLDRFDREPFLVEHDLVNHPLLQLPRLIKLCLDLPPECVEFNAGNLSVGQDPGLTPRTGLSAEETLRRIEECQSWMVLKYVERDPEYRDLLDRCLDEIATISDGIEPGMDRREGFIFVSSPSAVTPYHMDPELNFLLQIRGTKTIRVFPPHDRSVISEQDLERFYTLVAHRNMAYRDDLAQKARVFELGPGIGVHVPVTAPHWVQVGSAVSISFSITFRTDASERRLGVYTVNAAMRKRGLAPRPFGQTPLCDSLKYLGFRVYRRTRRP